MRIALIFGMKCSAYLPPDGFDIGGLYDAQALTGSESGIFNLAWGLSEREHQVDVFCMTKEPVIGVEKLAGANVYPLNTTPMGPDYDAYIAWNEPDYLRPAPKDKLRICSHQLNDFAMCEEGFDEFVDFYACPSEPHRKFIAETTLVMERKTTVIPNSINLEFFEPLPASERRQGSMIYCSSPDRGLHRLLEIFPRVRRRIPEANLKIFYRFEPWYQHVREYPSTDLLGTRARYINECLLRLGRHGENGVTLVGPIGNKQMARELCQAKLLAYPCDPIRYTEGFSISIMDACAAGAVPVISDVDALGAIYGDRAAIIPGRPGHSLERWADTLSSLLLDEERRAVHVENCRKLAEKHSRKNIAMLWEKFIMKNGKG